MSHAHRRAARSRRGGVLSRSAASVAVAAVAVFAVTGAQIGATSAALPRAVQGGSSADDWPSFHGNQLLSGYAANSSLSTTNASTLGVAWATNLYGAALDSPVVAYDATLDETLAYIGTENGDVLAINAATGQTVWGTWLGAPIRTTPVVSNGAVWVGTFDSPRIYKLDASTGAVYCSVASPMPIEGTPAAATPPGGVPSIYIGTNDSQTATGPILAINASTCGLEWSFTGYPILTGNWTGMAYAVDATGEPLIVFGTSDPDAAVYAVDAVTGKELWRFAVYNPPPGVYDVGAGVDLSPPGANGFAGGVAYVPSKYGIMYALDLTTGAVLWQTNYGQVSGTTGQETGRSTAALDGTNLVFGYAQGLFDLDADTGAVVWQYRDPSATEALSSPAIAGASPTEVAAVGDIAGSLDVVSLATGAQLYHYQTGGYITASPAVSGGNILLASSDGFLYDFAPGGGNEATPPTTAITSPADSSTLANPNGFLTVKGSATDPVGVAGVQVAVQSGGPTGPWWDGATRSWSSGPVANGATVLSPGATSTTWSSSFPVPAAGGVYTVFADTTSAAGRSDIKGSRVGFTVMATTTGAHIKASPAFIAPGAAVTVTGGGFKANEHIALNATIGPASVLATGATSGRSAAAPVTIGNSWEQFGYGPNHQGFEPNDPALYNLVHPGGNIFVDTAWNYQTGTVVDTAPAVVDGVAYAGTSNGELIAVDVHNGAPAWTWKDSTGKAVAGSPAVDPPLGLVFAGVDDGTLDAISTKTGKLVWKASLGGNVSAPVFAGGTLYVTTSSGKLAALAEPTGKVVWSVKLASPAASAPALDTGTGVLVVGEANGHLQEVKASNGSLGRVFSASGAITATPAIFGGVVYFGSAGDRLYAVSESKGAQIWAYTTSGPVNDTPALTNQLTSAGALELLVGDNAGKFYALFASNASLNYEISYGPAVTGVAAVKGVAVLELASGVVAAVRTYTDLDTWKFRTSAKLATAPVIDDGAIYVGAGDGNLYAFTAYGAPPT
jgi:outer membrane protein assembly factor BamB